MVQASPNAVFYATSYHPIQAGSIDGTDTVPHDNAVHRAMIASTTGLYDPTGDPKAEGDPYCTVFVGRLSRTTTENTLHEAMSRYGRVKSLRIVRNFVTGASQGYAFVEYESDRDMWKAYEAAHMSNIDGRTVLVDYNRQQLMPGWIPRRFGGGFGGRKESGQLRFGGRERPFRAPLRSIPHAELQKLGIPLPPEGNYMARYMLPPPPKRRGDNLDHYRHKQGANVSRSYSPEVSRVDCGRGSQRRPEQSRDLKSSSNSLDILPEMGPSTAHMTADVRRDEAVEADLQQQVRAGESSAGRVRETRTSAGVRRSSERRHARDSNRSFSDRGHAGERSRRSDEDKHHKHRDRKRERSERSQEEHARKHIRHGHREDSTNVDSEDLEQEREKSSSQRRRDHR